MWHRPGKQTYSCGFVSSVPEKGLQCVADRGVDKASADHAAPERVSQAAPKRRENLDLLRVLLARTTFYWLIQGGIEDPYRELC
jgi:hypothetical protein